MRTGEFGRLHLGCCPELLFDGLASGREFCGGRTPNEQTFNDWPAFYFPWRGTCKEFHFFMRVDK
jgi:hypothetical protein